jgi:energy-coupling factor transporter transmembrane protein EcfT
MIEFFDNTIYVIGFITLCFIILYVLENFPVVGFLLYLGRGILGFFFIACMGMAIAYTGMAILGTDIGLILFFIIFICGFIWFVFDTFFPGFGSPTQQDLEKEEINRLEKTEEVLEYRKRIDKDPFKLSYKEKKAWNRWIKENEYEILKENVQYSQKTFLLEVIAYENAREVIFIEDATIKGEEINCQCSCGRIKGLKHRGIICKKCNGRVSVADGVMGPMWNDYGL